jgi:hypothetical protein
MQVQATATMSWFEDMTGSFRTQTEESRAASLLGAGFIMR